MVRDAALCHDPGMQIDDDDDDLVAAPAGVRLRDPDDTDGVREDIESGVMKAMQNYVHGYEYGGTRLELSDMAYADKPRYSLAEQREALLKDSTLARRLRGTVTLVDTETNKPLEIRKNMTLARVPYLTQRGTMIHNGSEYAPVSQSRLLPGAYTRKRNNGELETHFNVRPGTGSAMRMSLDPTTGQYRMRVGSSNVHAYSVFKDLGVSDDEMERRWGPEILEANRSGYDSRAVDRVYMKAIPRWQRDASLPKADKARNVVEAFSRAQVAGAVLRENLPNLYSREKAASWRLQGLAMEKLAGRKLVAAEPDNSAPLEEAPQMSLVEATQALLKKSAAAAAPVKFKPTTTTAPQAHHRYLADDDEHEAYESIGIDGLLAASEKLLAVNRGLERPDQRDTASNERVYTVDRLMSERVKLDHGKTLRTLMGRLSRRKNLSALGPAAFDAYTVDYLKGNPTASAIEEINPMNIMEQRRRITKMGPGGIGDPNAITIGMQCHSDDTEVFTKRGWKFWPDVTESDELACRVDGRLEFHPPDKLHVASYTGPMHRVASNSVSYLVTPNHRFWSASSSRTAETSWQFETAQQQEGKNRCHVCASLPYLGTDSRDKFTLPGMEKEFAKAHVEFTAVDMGDWCEFLGWYAAEGCLHHSSENLYCVIITQCPRVNPKKWETIRDLLTRLPFNFSKKVGQKNFKAQSKQLYTYLLSFGDLCGNKTVPEFIFEVAPDHRRRFLDAYLAGDGWTQKSGSGVYSTSSPAMAGGIERLIIGMGRPSSRGTPWLARLRDGTPGCWMHRANELTATTSNVVQSQRETVEYSGEVYCASVTGGLLLTRRGAVGKPLWSGNSVDASQFGFISASEGPESEKAGIDVRLSYGARIGSDGRIYQIMRNTKTGKKQWVSPTDVKGKTIRLPD